LALVYAPSKDYLLLLRNENTGQAEKALRSRFMGFRGNAILSDYVDCISEVHRIKVPHMYASGALVLSS